MERKINTYEVINMRVSKNISNSDYPIFVNFYTCDNGYEKVAPYLIDSLEKFGLPYYIVEIDSNGDPWEKICQQKPYLLLEVLDKYPDKNVVWIDADAVVEKMPEEFLKIEKDIGTCYTGSSLNSATIYFKNNETCRKIIADWIKENNKSFKVWDQVTLDKVLNETYKNHVHVLPHSYVGIFNPNAVISQWQFSRNIKPKNSYEKGFNPDAETGEHPSRYGNLSLGSFIGSVFPEIMHHIFWDFTDKNRPLTEITEFNTCRNSWLNHHQNWTAKLWDKPDMNEFVKKYFPQYFEAWDNLDKKIKKVDMFRYMVLYIEGGLYVDLDIECFINFNSLIEKYQNYDIILYCHGTENSEICNNGIMISKPNNQFWIKMIEYGFENQSKNVLGCTGPPALGKLAFKNHQEHNIKLQDHYYDKILQNHPDAGKFCCCVEGDDKLKQDKAKKYEEWQKKGYHVGNFHCTPKEIHWINLKD
jgi:hypothetical protein